MNISFRSLGATHLLTQNDKIHQTFHGDLEVYSTWTRNPTNHTHTLKYGDKTSYNHVIDDTLVQSSKEPIRDWCFQCSTSLVWRRPRNPNPNSRREGVSEKTIAWPSDWARVHNARSWQGRIILGRRRRGGFDRLIFVRVRSGIFHSVAESLDRYHPAEFRISQRYFTPFYVFSNKKVRPCSNFILRALVGDKIGFPLRYAFRFQGIDLFGLYDEWWSVACLRCQNVKHVRSKHEEVNY